MAAPINSPSLLSRNQDYQLECRFSLEPSIVGLVDKAQ